MLDLLAGSNHHVFIVHVELFTSVYVCKQEKFQELWISYEVERKKIVGGECRLKGMCVSFLYGYIIRDYEGGQRGVRLIYIRSIVAYNSHVIDVSDYN